MSNIPHNPPNMCTKCGGYNYKAPKTLNAHKCNCKEKEWHDKKKKVIFLRLVDKILKRKITIN